MSSWPKREPSSGGGAALGATFGFVIGSLAQDLGVDADPDVWARQGGLWGGVAGIVLFIEGA